MGKAIYKKSYSELSHRVKALCAIVFLYKHVLKKDIGDFGEIVWAKKSSHIPVVFTREEVRTIMERLDGIYWLMAMLLYGAGLRLMECLRLRVKDIDFNYNQITIRDTKSKKDRLVPCHKSSRNP